MAKSSSNSYAIKKNKLSVWPGPTVDCLAMASINLFAFQDSTTKKIETCEEIGVR